MTRTKLATTLEHARLRAALTQRDLAAAAGVRRQTVWHWEHNSSIPGLKTLRRLTDILELDWDEVLRLRAAAEQARHATARPSLDTVAAVVAIAAMAF